MTELLGVLAVCGTVAFLWMRAEPLLREWLAWRTRVTALPQPAPLPLDIQMATLKYQEKWAQDQALKAVQELYAQHGDWDKVRAILPQLGM